MSDDEPIVIAYHKSGQKYLFRFKRSQVADLIDALESLASSPLDGSFDLFDAYCVAYRAGLEAGVFPA